MPSRHWKMKQTTRQPATAHAASEEEPAAPDRSPDSAISAGETRLSRRLPGAERSRAGRLRACMRALCTPPWSKIDHAVQVRFGPFTLNLDTRQLTQEGREIHLAPKAFDLLAALVADRPKVLSKAELQQRLWPETFVAEAN